MNYLTAMSKYRREKEKINRIVPAKNEKNELRNKKLLELY